MRIKHLKKEHFKTAAWSGGTTTELFLWPENGSYADRNFTLRISSATVNVPESAFTALPGVYRYITPLSGSFTLTHPGKPPVFMGPMAEPYGFSGGEKTHCVGLATDFNLMLKGVAGSMTLAGEKQTLIPGFHGLYAPQGARIRLEEEVYTLAAGELLTVFADKPLTAFPEGPVICCFAAI